MKFFNKNKTKWQPIFMYKPVAFNAVRLVYARYDRDTGLYDFKTQIMYSDNYSSDAKLVEYNMAEILNKLKSGVENE